jgi:hypothetical protein
MIKIFSADAGIITKGSSSDSCEVRKSQFSKKVIEKIAKFGGNPSGCFTIAADGKEYSVLSIMKSKPTFGAYKSYGINDCIGLIINDKFGFNDYYAICGVQTDPSGGEIYIKAQRLAPANKVAQALGLNITIDNVFVPMEPETLYFLDSSKTDVINGARYLG